jgi:nitronate monooxygenase
MVSNRFDVAGLAVPVIVAPMAGGPSTPELAAAVTNAGGLGFIAAGLLNAEALAARVVAARKLTSGPLGVNLFVPQPSAGTPAEFKAYASALTDEAEHYGVRLGEPLNNDDDWAAKLDVVHDLRPEVVSFTFGLPTMDECGRLKDAGITAVATVTTVDEARTAVARGADALVGQGPRAGGHRGTFDPAARPADQPLAELLAALAARVDVPIVAAGGLATSDDVHRVISAGAVAAQLGTAFLRADEAGTNPVHRAALADPQFTETVVTRAFTGRYARGLRNRFIEKHEDEAPFGFPQVGMLTGPVQAASVKAGDPHGTSLWAGTAFHKAKADSAAAIIWELA